MNDATIISLIALLASIILILGGIYALIKQTVYIDAETGNITELDVPLLGKLKTNYPSLIAIVCGAILVWQINENRNFILPKMQIAANVDVLTDGNPEDLDIFAVVVPRLNKLSTPINIPLEDKVEFLFSVDQSDHYDLIVYTPAIRDNKRDDIMVTGPVKIDETGKAGSFSERLLVR